MGGCLPSYPQAPESTYDSHSSALDSKKPGAHFKNWTYVETHNQNNTTLAESKTVLEEVEETDKKALKAEKRKSGGSRSDSGDEGDEGDRADIRQKSRDF